MNFVEERKALSLFSGFFGEKPVGQIVNKTMVKILTLIIRL